MSYEHVKIWRTKTKERLIESFGGKCGICGYDKCIQSLEFHHIDETEKEFTISHFKVLNWDKIVAEARKCVCLCSNCHREVHFGVTEIPKDILRFDESYADYKTLEKQKLKDLCPVCNSEKSIWNKTCSLKCHAKIRQKVDWDNIDLIDLVENQNKSYSSIARDLGISNVAVRKRYLKLVERIPSL
jgi:hypothetical protein